MSENLNETNQAVEEQETPPSAEAPAEEAAESPAPEAEAAAEGDAAAEAAAGDETPAAGEAEGEAEAEGGAETTGEAEAAAETEGGAAPETGEGEEVRRAEFSPIAGTAGGAVRDNLDLILGVTVPVTIELGSTEMYFRDIMALGPGAVVRLDRPVGDPVDLLVNGELVGRGEVVVVDERYGVRVTELCRPEKAEKEAK